MARASIDLITALRNTIKKLNSNAPYQWGHMGACNCGNLAQELTKLSKAEIHQFAMQKHGDWNDQLIDFCPTSGYPMDLMINKMLEKGLSIDDLKHLETLTHPQILRKMPLTRRNQLHKNNKTDVVYYMEVWLELLEEEWQDFYGNKLLNEVKKNIGDKVLA